MYYTLGTASSLLEIVQVLHSRLTARSLAIITFTLSYSNDPLKQSPPCLSQRLALAVIIPHLPRYVPSWLYDHEHRIGSLPSPKSLGG